MHAARTFRRQPQRAGDGGRAAGLGDDLRVLHQEPHGGADLVVGDRDDFVHQPTDVRERDVTGPHGQQAIGNRVDADTQRGQRPEKLRQQMAKDGTLANLYVQMREAKAVDRIIEKSKVEDVDLQS